MNIKPLSDRVVIEPTPLDKLSPGGIIIPDTVQDKPQRGTIIAAGKGKGGEPMEVKVGDIVLYAKNAGTEIEHEGKKVLLMREVDVFAVL